MFKKFGSTLSWFGRKARIAASLMSVAAVTAITTVVSSAAGETTTTDNSLAESIKSAGETLETSLTALVTALAPVLVTVSVSGLGIYGVVMLFKLGKKLFSKAAG